MTWAGVPVIYLAAAGLVTMALLLTWRLKTASVCTAGGRIIIVKVT